jgi:hypothetical protein
MLRFLFMCCGLLLALKVLAAENVITHIEEIDPGADGEEALIFLGNGKVAKLAVTEKYNLHEFKSLEQQRLIARFELDTKRRIKQFTLMPGKMVSHSDHEQEKLLASFQPTFIESLKHVQELFKQMRRGSLEDSQCYNRAHVWAFDWKKNLNINSMKMWIFLLVNIFAPTTLSGGFT